MSAHTGPVLNRYYDLEYYSGSQATVYIGDVFVDEITHIEWRRQQEKTPLYGYASQLFDGTARGHVLVSGAFSINWKESGYLWAILRRWFSIGSADIAAMGKADPVSNKKAKMINAGKLGAENNGIGGRPIMGSNRTQVSRASLERLLQGKASRQERYKFYQSLAGYATFSPGGGKDKIFEDIVEVFEDQLWKYPDNRKLLEQLRRVDDNMFDGFDIYTLFGNYANPKANHTAVKIVGVRITGESQMVVIDGQPIQQTFTFIARTTV